MAKHHDIIAPKKVKKPSKPKPAPIPPPKGLEKLVQDSRFRKWYVWFSLGLLLLTCLFWAVQSARLQLNNADQLVDPYLFSHITTFHGAFFPSAHSYLLKWPLFWLIKLFGFSSSAYAGVTVGLVLLTVGGLVLTLRRIEKRPLVFGTLCLALASMLILVPAQPYAGALLPVNLAMLTTRNIEYLLYILSLLLFVRSAGVKSRNFWLGVITLSLLIASDKLFLPISFGGALLALMVAALTRVWSLVSSAVNWLVGTLLAAVLSIGGLWLLTAVKLTHLVGQSASPYPLIATAHDGALGGLYAVLSVLTNFGANPAYDATIVRHIPSVIWSRLISVAGPAYIINLVLLGFGLLLTWQLLVLSLKQQKRKADQLNASSTLAVFLIWSALAAVGVFVATNHYYAVDARYLSLALFAVFVAAAITLRGRRFRPEQVVVVGAVIFVGSLLGLLGSHQTYRVQSAAFNDVNSRNALVATALSEHPVSVLLGDYWRVLPIKFKAAGYINVLSLSSCTAPSISLTSQTWQPSLYSHSFAYLLSLDRGLTGYPSCSLGQIVSSYGRPNASTLIAGTLSQPKELLLFYDRGIHLSSPTTPPPAKGPATIFPISIDQLPNINCDRPTILTVVAHQDDDLLFTSPDLLHSIRAGYCIRTVYVTAGDAGFSQLYWLGRERGSEAAYTSMLGQTSNTWVQRIVQLSAHQFVEVASPRNNAQVMLVFMHLPDGNLDGQGFKATRNESLARLESGKTPTIQAVDGQSSYSSSDLTKALASFMFAFNPTEIRTQANYISPIYPDHSDHMAVGRYVKLAYKQYEQQQYGNNLIIPLRFYIGYPIHGMLPNVSGADLQAKEAAYFAYSALDNAVCHNLHACNTESTFGHYLDRQYQNAY